MIPFQFCGSLVGSFQQILAETFPGIFVVAEKLESFPARILLAVLIAVMVLVVYWQTGAFSFVDVDDGLYVANNPQVQAGLTGEGIVWSFTTVHASNWHPLTWMSHMLDVDIFGMDAGWHHRVNLLFHAANSILLFLVLMSMTKATWRSFFVAALFAVHPLHVESVAWIAERKDLLSTFFWLLAIGAYQRFTVSGGIGRYALMALFLALGLLSKPMVVTLPFTLLLLDFWPLARIGAPMESGTAIAGGGYRRLILEKAPLLALSFLSCLATFMAQQAGGSVHTVDYSLGVRLSNAAVSYVAYLWKTVWPASLAVYYPHPWDAGGMPAWSVAAAFLCLGGITFLCLRNWKKRPYLATGWLWYLGTAVPVIGLVQVGGQGMADRYTYVPLIGIFVIVAWGVPEIVGRHRFGNRILGFAAAAILSALMAASWVQASYWRESIPLFEHAIELTTGNWNMHYNLAVAYHKQSRIDDAIAEYRKALRINPDDALSHNNLAMDLSARGRAEEAQFHFREAQRLGMGSAPGRQDR